MKFELPICCIVQLVQLSAHIKALIHWFPLGWASSRLEEAQKGFDEIVLGSKWRLHPFHSAQVLEHLSSRRAEPQGLQANIQKAIEVPTFVFDAEIGQGL